MSDKAPPKSQRLKQEAALLAVLLFFGIALLPIAIWFIGDLVFGSYGGNGYVDFFNRLGSELRSGNLVAWFLVLSPWLAVQVIRLSLLGWRYAGKL